MTDLWERRAGLGLENTLELVFDDEQAVYGLVGTAVETIVGFGIVMVLPPTGVEEYFPVPTDSFPTGDVNAILHAGAVTENWEGRGVGSELMRLRVELVQDVHDVDTIFGNAWLRPHTVDASALFEKHGFERLRTVERSYQRSDNERDCPDCDPDPCMCSSAVYVKSLN